MSSIFDFIRSGEKEEEMPPQAPSSIFEYVKTSPTTPEAEDYTAPAPPSVSEQLSAAGPLFSKEAAAGLWAFPSNVAEAYRYLGGRLQARGEKLAQSEGREVTPEERKFTSNMVNYLPDLLKEAGKKFPRIFPTHEEAGERVAKKIREGGGNLPDKPRGAIERAATGAGKAVSILAFPGSAATKLAAIGTSAATEAADLSEGKKLAGNLTVPAIVSVIESIVRKKYVPPKGVQEHLYKEGKRLGMSDIELAPIMATKGQVERHGALAQGASGTKEAFEKTSNILGNVIEDMQSRPQNLIPLSTQAESKLLKQLTDIETNIRSRSHQLSPKELQFADFIKGVVENIHENGSNPRQLIGTWRSINKAGGGKTELRRVTEPLLEAIESVDPQLAKDLTSTNALYSRFVGNLKEISPSQFNAFIDAGELQQVLGAVFSGNPASLSEKILNVVGLKALRKISSAILTDPTAQSLVRNFGKAVRDGKGVSARAVGIQFQDYVKKNLPEEYGEINWNELVPPDAAIKDKDRNDRK